LEDALGKDIPLPVLMKGLQFWVDWCRGLPGKPYVEQKWAIDRQYQPTEYFGSPWMRSKVDFATVHGPIGWLVDWKTGKRLEEPLQLWLNAMVMFAQFPELRRIESMFVWLKEDDGINSGECISVEHVKREETGEIWEQLLPRIKTYEDACQTQSFPPRPGMQCRWCRVQSCEFFGGNQSAHEFFKE
jgi:hypothetical protein